MGTIPRDHGRVRIHSTQTLQVQHSPFINQFRIMPDHKSLSARNYVKAVALLNRGETNQAAALFYQVVSQDPSNTSAVMQLARLLLAHQHFLKALSVLEKHQPFAPKEHAYWHMLGALQLKQGKPTAALESAERALEIASTTIATINLKGNILLELGNFEDAIATFKAAIALNSNEVDPHNNIAWAYRALGEKERAIHHFAEAYRLEPSATEALSGILLLKTFQDASAPEIEEATLKLKDQQLPIAKRVELSFATGKAFEDSQDYSQAFHYFKQGNQIWRQTLKYDPKQEQAYFDTLKTSYSEHKEKVSPNDAPTPIFVLGMPRSSTSLVEQILASHSKVTGAGELDLLNSLLTGSGRLNWRPEQATKIRQAYLSGIEKKAEGKRYVVDKMPQNFRYIGIILQCWPEAKIIHCQRDPRDNCLSLFKHHFPMTSHPYAYQEDELVHYYGLYQDLMKHWNDIAPGKLLNLSYEALVEDFDTQLETLLDFTGLSFEPACRDFQNTKRAIRTASSDQVRRGLYTSGKGQWQNYEQQLGEMFEELARLSGV